MTKNWIEVSLYTKTEQIASVSPNENLDGIILKTIEQDKSFESRLYLTFEEARDLSKQLLIQVENYDEK